MRILVTGATDGIGKATATALIRLGHAVVIHGRPGVKAEAALRELRQVAVEYGAPVVDLVMADLADLNAVDAAALEVTERFSDLQVLINNAGVVEERRAVSADGFEANWAVNHLAPMLLTMRLLPTLRANAPARVVMVSSMVHERARIEWDDLNAEEGYDAYRAYSRSKLANVLFTRALDVRLRERAGRDGANAPDVTVNALHPGVIHTKLLHKLFAGGESVDAGARTSVFLATDLGVAGVSGRYFVDSRQASSRALEGPGVESDRLWDVSLEMIERAVGHRPVVV